MLALSRLISNYYRVYTNAGKETKISNEPLKSGKLRYIPPCTVLARESAHASVSLYACTSSRQSKFDSI